MEDRALKKSTISALENKDYHQQIIPSRWAKHQQDSKNGKNEKRD